MLFYQPTFDMLELKEDKSTDYIIGLRQNGVYTSDLTPLYTAFLHSIKLSGYTTRIQLDNRVLVA